MTHDPMCPLAENECPGRDRPHFIVEGDTWCGGCQIECQCPLIAKVRADERWKIIGVMERNADGDAIKVIDAVLDML